ncbi:MAG: hypothetical protein HPY54_16485 [Chthonomonadetes bacterium]|nr:hypothetical protein [Chthonomonadetes bacterium]
MSSKRDRNSAPTINRCDGGKSPIEWWKIHHKHFKGLRTLQQMVGTRLRAGIVLYWGEHMLPFGEGLWAQPISALWMPYD